jgi:uncharacterized protein DUF4437
MKTLKLSVLLAVTAGLAFAAGTATKKQLLLIPAGDAKFAPNDPSQPQGPQSAILNGDPKSGPVSFLLKYRGTSPLHSHTSDYQAVLISGSAAHYAEGKDGEAKASGPGTFWFQPGKQVHGDRCESEECIIYVSMPGGMDFIPAGGGARGMKM